MTNIANPQDPSFRTSMQHASTAKQFFGHYLPSQLLNEIDINSFKLEDRSHVDESLQESFSDLVFDGHYIENERDRGTLKIIFLVKHQSTPKKLTSFWVYQYLYNMVYKMFKKYTQQQVEDEMSLIYVLGFCNAKKTPYICTLDLIGCINYPLRIMDRQIESSLKEVNQVKDDELIRQQLLSMMSGFRGHGSNSNVTPYLRWLAVNSDSTSLSQAMTLVLHYSQYIGDIDRTEMLIKSKEHMPQPIDSGFYSVAESLRESEELKKRQAQGECYEEMTIMTAAEVLRSWGEELGIEEFMEKFFVQAYKL
ncbi:MAG: Rpn family recombination-promoting nuclease/putative transposase [Psychrosphaera sp.]|nr:Rpn family recombination-promoting nuclease/putative transposase [Psychrosphaera sp.]